MVQIASTASFFHLLLRSFHLLRHLYLQTEIDVLYRLMDDAGTQDVDLWHLISVRFVNQPQSPLTVDRSCLQISLCNVPTRFEKKLSLSLPLLLQFPSNAHEFFALDVVEHDDVRTGVNRFVSFGFRTDFDV